MYDTLKLRIIHRSTPVLIHGPTQPYLSHVCVSTRINMIYRYILYFSRRNGISTSPNGISNKGTAVTGSFQHHPTKKGTAQAWCLQVWGQLGSLCLHFHGVLISAGRRAHGRLIRGSIPTQMSLNPAWMTRSIKRLCPTALSRL